jgi:two-component system, cell cycle sensor histidine kinase and response regulator CckA
MGTAQPLSPAILLVEDDDQVRGLVRSLLTADGYRVFEARTGAEGLRIGEEQDGAIDLLLSDMLLPELSGYDLAAALKERNPGLKIVLMTGYVEGEIVQRCVSELGAAFLDKPFQPAALRQLLKETLQVSPAT